MQRAEDAGRFVALTFDDGYADNYTTAMPVLTRLGVPFTVFLTSGFLDRAVPMWWVGLEAILSQQDRLNLPERTLPARTTAEKMAAFAVAEQIIRRLPRKELACFCASVFNLNARANPRGVACAAALDWGQARAMARTGLVSFGCHTLSHPVLAWLDPIRCKSEIATARDRIVEELGLMPEFFAYPYGGSEEVGVHAPKLVAECGFRAAFTTSRRLLVSPLRDADLYALPRLVLDSEDLALTRTHISGLAWALRDIGARMRWPAGAAKAPQS
jgi:peptidoglycan/xylan/chitin deacetylase (PgdA/CDA1 family)